MEADEEKLKAALMAALDEKLGPFFIEREQHYLDHQFICGIRRYGDKIKGEACKTVTHGAIAGLFLLVLYGIYYLLFGPPSPPHIKP